MTPYRILEKIAADLDSLDTRQTVSRALDDLEEIYDALDPEFQPLADELIERLMARLSET